MEQLMERTKQTLEQFFHQNQIPYKCQTDATKKMGFSSNFISERYVLVIKKNTYKFQLKIEKDNEGVRSFFYFSYPSQTDIDSFDSATYFDNLEEMRRVLKKRIKKLELEGMFQGEGKPYLTHLIQQFTSNFPVEQYPLCEKKIANQLMEHLNAQTLDELELRSKEVYMLYAPGGTEVDHFRLKENRMNYDIPFQELLK